MGGAGAQLGQARESVQQQIFSLPADTLVCPGHGPLTTVGEEREHNPFFL
jgi:glyoxylase-like metal-dependent hydrolase (beta-lactamase superfamily II)